MEQQPCVPGDPLKAHLSIIHLCVFPLISHVVDRELRVQEGISYELLARDLKSIYPTLHCLHLVRPVEEVIELGRQRHLGNSSECLFIHLLIVVTGIGSSFGLKLIDWEWVV